MFERKTGVSKKTAGYAVLITMLGMALVTMGQEIKGVTTWGELLTPQFVGTALMHLGTVVGAYVGGRFTPNKGE
jgi:hypothetical protein